MGCGDCEFDKKGETMLKRSVVISLISAWMFIPVIGQCTKINVVWANSGPSDTWSWSGGRQHADSDGWICNSPGAGFRNAAHGSTRCTHYLDKWSCTRRFWYSDGPFRVGFRRFHRDHGMWWHLLYR